MVRKFILCVVCSLFAITPANSTGAWTIHLNRHHPFDPAASDLLGPGWSIWKGSAEGDGLTGSEEQDPRSLQLVDVDVDAIVLQGHLRGNEKYIGPEERLARLRQTGHILLDAQVGAALVDHPNVIPRTWIRKLHGERTSVLFDGTVFRAPNGTRCVIYLEFDGTAWGYGGCASFRDGNKQSGWHDYDFSAVLAQ